ISIRRMNPKPNDISPDKSTSTILRTPRLTPLPSLISNSKSRYRKEISAMRVAFLGLGIMGHAMATNLVKAGHEVTVWNRTPGKMVEGAGIAPTPSAAAQGAEVIWLCVSDTAAVEKTLFGPEGVEPALADGTIVADSSTISPSATVKFAQRLRSKGVAY